MEKRRDVRIRAHWGVCVRWEGGEARGLTENLSPWGSMVSLEDEPPLSRGQALQMILQLPGQGRAIEIAAKVRWVSEMLPNTMGIEFEHGLPEDAVGVLQAIAAA